MGVFPQPGLDWLLKRPLNAGQASPQGRGNHLRSSPGDMIRLTYEVANSASTQKSWGSQTPRQKRLAHIQPPAPQLQTVSRVWPPRDIWATHTPPFPPEAW